MVGDDPPEPDEVGDRGVGEDDRAAAMALAPARSAIDAEGADADAGVDQYRHPGLGGHPEDRVDVRVVEPEGLGPRVQLDPAGAAP